MRRYIRFSPLILVLFFTTAINKVFAQNCVSINMPDTVVTCANVPVSVHVTRTVPTGYDLIDSSWSPLQGIDTTNFLSPIFFPGSTSGYYTLTYYAVTPNQLVQDGNFDSLNTNNQYFTSDYTDTSGFNSLWPEAHYSITNDPNNVHSNFASFPDHTTGTGNMMVINGAGSPVDIWCQTITVTPNTYYDFSAWAASCTPAAPAIIQFKINGVLIDSPLNLSSTVGQWQEFHVIWYSDTSTSITICINDQQTALSGNDFAIDDISFRTVCESQDSVYVKIPDLADTMLVSQQPCQDGKVTLTVQNKHGYLDPAAVYTWEFGDNTTNATGTTVTHTYSHPNYYLITLGVSNGGCVDSIEGITLINNFTPRLPASNDTSICKGTHTQLWVAPGTTYQWSPDYNINSTTSRTPTVHPDVDTTYYVTVHFGQGCVTQDTVHVSLYPSPVIQVTPPSGTVTCAAPALQLHASGAISYTWYPNIQISDPLAADPYVSPEETTDYIVTGTDEHNCYGTDTVHITVPDVSHVFLPSAFTPNNDGKNDILKPIPYCGFTLQEFYVYNRWGQEVYHTNTPAENGWDGTYNGQPAPMDTYYYYVVGTDKSGNQKVVKGQATLIR